jgi:hypothetical protein
MLSLMNIFWGPVLMAGMIFSAGCATRLCLAPALSARELLAQYQTQTRLPVSAGFSAVSSTGFFSGEIYLEKREKLSALVYGYLAIGQPLFQLSLDNDAFLYLDFSARAAYSNRKDWLKDFETRSSLGPEQETIQFLARALKALAGEIKPKPENAILDGKVLRVSETLEPGNEVEYVFKKAPLRLLEINQKGAAAFSAQFSYRDPCWFPSRLKAQNAEFNLQITFSQLTCPETRKPDLSFQPPPGFRQILVP